MCLFLRNSKPKLRIILIVILSRIDLNINFTRKNRNRNLDMKSNRFCAKLWTTVRRILILLFYENQYKLCNPFCILQNQKQESLNT